MLADNESLKLYIGAGVDYRIGERYSLFAAYGHTLWGENAHLIDYAVSVGVSRGF